MRISKQRLMTKWASSTILARAVLIAALFNTSNNYGQSPDTTASSDRGFGNPLPGLTAAQLAAFNDGKTDFETAEVVSEGMGPIFNRDSCGACHSGPSLGGSSPITATRFGQMANGSFNPLNGMGGSLLQERAISPEGLEQIPRQANVIALRQTPALYGSGLIEAIPDIMILKGARQLPVNGVLGKASLVVDAASGKTRVGRFGWKAQHATLLAFAGDAYLNEMGITNRLFPAENAPNGNQSLLRLLDKVSDPEDVVDPKTGKAGIDMVGDYMRYLDAPPTKPLTISNVFGAKLFLDVGCASCHTPFMMTGVSTTAALNLKVVPLYSDLLLHDMGRLGDGIVQDSAGANDMRTAPLWGVGASAPYLHDGRARTLDDAIRAHDGEGRSARDWYLRLTPSQRDLLIDFLNSI